jgi:hypothetical protein
MYCLPSSMYVTGGRIPPRWPVGSSSISNEAERAAVYKAIMLRRVIRRRAGTVRRRGAVPTGRAAGWGWTTRTICWSPCASVRSRPGSSFFRRSSKTGCATRVQRSSGVRRFCNGTTITYAVVRVSCIFRRRCSRPQSPGPPRR